MTAKRAIMTGLVGAVILAAVYLFATPLAWLLTMTGEEMFPSRVSWDGKTAWIRCESAIAGRTSWPDSPQGRCAAMQLCANEAPLSEEQVELLTQAIRNTPGCEGP